MTISFPSQLTPLDTISLCWVSSALLFGAIIGLSFNCLQQQQQQQQQHMLDISAGCGGKKTSQKKISRKKASVNKKASHGFYVKRPQYIKDLN